MKPKKVISLVPSLTELLFDLGLENHIVGVTRYCVHPEEKVKKLLKVGGTKRILIDRVKQLEPDWILANQEENRKEDVEKLCSFANVYVSRIRHFGDLYQLLGDLGEIFQIPHLTVQLAEQIQQTLAKIPKAKGIKVLYLIWKNPWMTVGGDTFIHAMLQTLGFENVYGHRQRYPEVSWEEIASSADVIFLPSEPYPFSEEEREEIEKEWGTPALLVDGQAFSWYGSRILHVRDYLTQLVKSLSE